MAKQINEMSEYLFVNTLLQDISDLYLSFTKKKKSRNPVFLSVSQQDESTACNVYCN